MIPNTHAGVSCFKYWTLLSSSSYRYIKKPSSRKFCTSIKFAHVKKCSQVPISSNFIYFNAQSDDDPQK
jgi:hypothetical protein